MSESVGKSDRGERLRSPRGWKFRLKGVCEVADKGFVHWVTVLTGGSLVASARLAGALFVGLAIFFGFRWRTSLLAVIAVVAVNVCYPGGASRVVSAALLPLQVLNSNVAGCRQAAIDEERKRPYP